MAQEDPDIDALFAPLPMAQASEVVLREAREVLAVISKPVDAELWGSDMIGALARNGTDGTDIMTELVAFLVPAAEKSPTSEALGLLRILGAIGSPAVRSAATEAAERVSAAGAAEPEWAAGIGVPAIGKCWHYSDIGGRQESITACFSYGEAEHALSVLIDHGQAGRIKDAWVDDAEGLLHKTWLAAENDPLIMFELIDAADAGARLEKAITAGECPVKPDEADDLSAHRALLHARVRYLMAS
jgi:hypothetical protein